MPLYERPYLVVETGDDYICVLNVSSSAGKDAKVQKKTNQPIIHYNPPLKRPSFVKLDSYTKVVNPPDNYTLLCGGAKLDEKELKIIIEKMKNYT